MASLADWCAWKDRCAIGLCPPDCREALQTFAHERYARYARTYAHWTNVSGDDIEIPDAGEAWHWFETHFRLHNTREGKCFKAWIFARTGSSGCLTLDGVQSGACLLMRNVVRERLRREYSESRVRSLDAPVAHFDASEPVALLDLLPGSDDTLAPVEQRELEAVAEQDADAIFGELSQRERVALLARELGLSLAHPHVVDAAGCGKSMLNRAFHTALTAIAGCVRSRHPREDQHTLASLAVLAFSRLRQRVFAWGESENKMASLFT